jgi:hypothetical protein
VIQSFVSSFIFIGLMCLLCITVVLLVLLFLVVLCVYFVSLLCCFPCIFIGFMCLLCITVVLFSLYFYWFDVFTLYRCCVVFLVFLLVWCAYSVSLLCCLSFCFCSLMCLLCITVVLFSLFFYWFDVISLYRCLTQQWYKVNTSNQ